MQVLFGKTQSTTNIYTNEFDFILFKMICFSKITFKKEKNCCGIFNKSNTLLYKSAEVPLHKKWSFPLRISSVNVAKSTVADLVVFTEEIFNAKLHSLCSVNTTELRITTKSLK